ncbi:P-loop containing nucleoside triphosphate hydrolase protein [Sphaerosporella brunnea]|uniref:P-loop containing nucleoside triphosphate hydrolase protein n=1 Tax=Sphaerosporella brunnea TaxID=1250544 RepID=A0A5J5EJN1_9PEZI|nr:P-loop containing nucleoside triphosphate hydrolase protein [Sphaerosporella brunnea]
MYDLNKQTNKRCSELDALPNLSISFTPSNPQPFVPPLLPPYPPSPPTPSSCQTASTMDDSEGMKTISDEPQSAKTTENVANTTGLDSLQSKELLELLDEIDKLRAFGVNEFVALPQLVVCGDQSSGKSSVLEAITQIPFPRSPTLCTRFATHVVLRRKTTTYGLVSIIPDPQRKGAVREELEKFAGAISDLSDLPALIEKAKIAMGLDNDECAFSKDTLVIEVCGPDKPQLTIVDLPGFIRSEETLRSKADAKVVSKLARRYMEDQRTIILAVVTAENDYANQIVLKEATEADPEGIRTLGIITKPDTLPAGSESKKRFVSLAKNEAFFLWLGWHVVRNGGYEERDCTFAERNRLEGEFFARGPWAGMDTGIDSLRTRLSGLLSKHIKRELPEVYKEISKKIEDWEAELNEIFCGITKSAIEGTYVGPFFGLVKKSGGKKKRLRGTVHAFAAKMRLCGHSREINDEFVRTHPNHPNFMTRKQAIEWVRSFLVLISELFWEQSKNWKQIAYKHVDKVFRRLQEFLRTALKDQAPIDVIDSLFESHIDTKMAERLDKANAELKRLLDDLRGHAITYNHEFIDKVQKARQKRVTERIAKLCNDKPRHSADSATKAIIRALTAHVEAGDCASEEALDSMLAYYEAKKVACKTFVDSVAITVVERQLMSNLWEVFSPTSVMDMAPETLALICEESPGIQKRRELLETKLNGLKGGLEVCERALKGVKLKWTSPRVLVTQYTSLECGNDDSDDDSDDDTSADPVEDSDTDSDEDSDEDSC